jgi:YHS domain-containing protein
VESEVEMMRRLRRASRSATTVALVVLVLISPVTSALAIDMVNETFFGVAIKGYDTVAYHTEGRAVKGRSEFAYTWNDAKWYFASTENKDLFAADPERYAPQYGGY